MSNEQEKIKDVKIKWFAFGTLFGLFFGTVFMLGYMLETQDENNLDASEKVSGSNYPTSQELNQYDWICTFSKSEEGVTEICRGRPNTSYSGLSGNQNYTIKYVDSVCVKEGRLTFCDNNPDIQSGSNKTSWGLTIFEAVSFVSNQTQFDSKGSPIYF